MKKQTKIQVKVQGISPLLMNRFRDESIGGKIKKRTGAVAEDDITDKLYLYDETPHIPAVYFRNCIVEAGKQFKIVGKNRSTYSKLLGSTIEVFPEMIKLIGSYKPYRIAAVNPTTKGRMMTERPRFDSWNCEFTIILNDESLDPSIINEILTHAGIYVGVGDWRPDKKGTFGKYMITSFREV